MPSLVPTREPKKAFEGARGKLETTGMFDRQSDSRHVGGTASGTQAPAGRGAGPALHGPILVPGTPFSPAEGRAAPAMVKIPAGTFLYGEAKRPEQVPTFEIDRDPVTNGEYERFVRA